ncbi:hypothetical protein P7C71_g48, partial [Lecanoromycetidae sp. Uapishka_2]
MYPNKPMTSRSVSDDPRNGNQDLGVGDVVDVPGGMHGTIKFIGEVKGKKGHFAGVELSKEFAARGKNDGDVDGIRYFTTSIKGAGIFLPSNKAYKRLSPSFSSDSMPPTPDTGSLNSFNLADRPISNQEVKQLRAELLERDRQLDRQNADLEEMQSSIAELQMVTPKHNSAGTMRSRGSGIDELDAPQLRSLVREKNDKIATLTSDFDAHRAQFRNTIDSLERTSDETNRIYEQQVETLKQEIRDLQDRGDDVESVAQQLKQLEELVQELEEGLEDARRGEAEARGEVEFLRGEVERGRSELRREQEKAAVALKKAGSAVEGSFSPSTTSREVEQKDDEIRGLKAIIHSLSRDAVPDMGSPKHGSKRVSKQRHSGLNQANGHTETHFAEERQAREKLEREVKDLEGLVDRKTYREEELEHEIERLRKTAAHVSASSTGYSEKTAQPKSNHRSNLSKASSNDWRAPSSPERQRGGQLEAMTEDSHSTTMTDSSTLYCEMCETFGHEIFTCPNINGEQQHQEQSHQDQRPGSSSQHTGRDVVKEGLRGLTVSSPHANDYPPPLSPGRSPARSPAMTPKASVPNPMDQGPMAGKSSGRIDMDKWCALCERDGHESVDCPFEDMY